MAGIRRVVTGTLMPPSALLMGTGTGPPLARTGSLVGRSAEFSLLRELLDTVRLGVGRTCLIAGEGGIGKTRLLAEAIDHAGQGGFRVLYGTADQLERDQPFGSIAAALAPVFGSADPDAAALADAISGQEGGVRPEASLIGTSDVGFRIVETIVTVLERLAASGPVVLALDDLHWADPSTLRAVRSIARRLAERPVALLLTYRPTVRNPELEEVTDALVALGAPHMVLGPLDREPVRAMTREVAGATPGPRLLAQVSAAAGNPLFVGELVRALRYEGALKTVDGVAEIGDVSFPPTLRLTILRRINTLPDATMEVLRIAAVMGQSFAPSHLAAVCARSVAQILGPLTDALRAGILEEEGERLAFRHELIRAAIYDDLPLALRRGLHREVAGALISAGAAPALVAEHLLICGAPGDAEAVNWLRDAAHDVASRSPAIAVDLLERALELADGSGPVRGGLVGDLAPLLVRVGRPGDAAALAREVLRSRPPPPVEAALHRALAAALWVRGELAAAVSEYDAASTVAGIADVEQVVTRALAAHLRMFLGDVDRARAEAESATADGERLGEDVAVCLGLQTASVVADAQGRVSEAVDLARRAVDLAGRSTHPQMGELLPHYHLGLMLMEADRFVEAEAALQQGLRLAEERGTVVWLPLYHWALAMLRCSTGHWEDAAAEVEGALTLVDDVGTRVHAPFLHGVLAWLAVHRGDPEGAQSRLGAARREMLAADHTWASIALDDVVEAGPHWPVEWGLWVEGVLAEAAGNTAQAFGAFDAAWMMAEPLRYYLGYRWFAPDLVRVALVEGRRDRAESVTAEVEVAAERSSVESASATARRCRGLIDDSPDLLVAAVAGYRRGGRETDAAFTAEEAAASLARVGRTNEAVGLLEEALGSFERMGAARNAARTTAALRSLGATVRRRGRAPARPAFGWESLTDTERRVVALVGRGHTNRQIAEQLFVSRRTIETHVYHVFQKLGMATRAHLAAEAARRT